MTKFFCRGPWNDSKLCNSEGNVMDIFLNEHPADICGVDLMEFLDGI